MAMSGNNNILSAKLVAISGGIGSGKSVVSHVLSVLGYHVYDTDSRAKQLMDTSEVIKRQLVEQFGRNVVVNGDIDRKYLSGLVFNQQEALEKLNAIVHGHVRTDIVEWRNRSDRNILFVETAILYQSGLDRMVDEVWEVVAPRHVRVERIMSRNGYTEQEAESRVVAQESYVPLQYHANIRTIINDGVLPVLPQIEGLLG